MTPLVAPQRRKSTGLKATRPSGRPAERATLEQYSPKVAEEVNQSISVKLFLASRDPVETFLEQNCVAEKYLAS